MTDRISSAFPYQKQRKRVLGLQGNFFIEKILPSAILRTLSPEEMANYRRPFAAAASADWLSKSRVRKLFFRAEPGAILANDQDLAFIRKFPALTEVAIAGRHYIQEDPPHEIGRAIVDWMKTLSRNSSPVASAATSRRSA